MRELELFRQYLVQLRAERLQQEHAYALGVTEIQGLLKAATCAHEAALVERILAALKDLDSDGDEFVHKYLERQ